MTCSDDIYDLWRESKEPLDGVTQTDSFARGRSSWKAGIFNCPHLTERLCNPLKII
jgi:hypothetical protein